MDVCVGMCVYAAEVACVLKITRLAEGAWRRELWLVSILYAFDRLH